MIPAELTPALFVTRTERVAQLDRLCLADVKLWLRRVDVPADERAAIGVELIAAHVQRTRHLWLWSG